MYDTKLGTWVCWVTSIAILPVKNLNRKNQFVEHSVKHQNYLRLTLPDLKSSLDCSGFSDEGKCSISIWISCVGDWNGGDSSCNLLSIRLL